VPEKVQQPDVAEPSGSGPVRHTRKQRSDVEEVCEKSTRNEVVVPQCEGYGMNLQTGAGERSITAALTLVKGMEQGGKAGRIICLSEARWGGAIPARSDGAKAGRGCAPAKGASTISGFSRWSFPPGMSGVVCGGVAIGSGSALRVRSLSGGCSITG
jgi:hypothetical protein